MKTLEQAAVAWLTPEEAADWQLFLGLRQRHLLTLLAYVMVAAICLPAPWSWVMGVGGCAAGQIYLMRRLRRKWRELPETTRRRIAAALAVN